MTLYNNRQIARAAVVQVKRVNEFASDDDLRTENERLIAENRRLRDLLEAYQQTAAATWKGRPVLTIAEAATQAGVKYHTAYRYVVKLEHWEGDQRDSGEWVVYADQPLVHRPKKKREKKQK